jgi:hypothetical protein
MSLEDEQTHLSLQKELYSVQYTDLTPHEAETQTNLSSEPGAVQDPSKIDLSSNAYLFLQEADILLKDLKNIIIYFQRVVFHSEKFLTTREALLAEDVDLTKVPESKI